jgi:aspartyl-tRNA(Asn)/glutamyl-tRNA(Gln) amidotransferase subunit C
MSISREEVRHIALLSRIRLSDEELDRFTGHLDEILAYAEKINELDTSDVPPTSHVVPIVNVMRDEDRVSESLDVREALANAPETDGSFFKVPRVTE